MATGEDEIFFVSQSSSFLSDVAVKVGRFWKGLGVADDFLQA